VRSGPVEGETPADIGWPWDYIYLEPVLYAFAKVVMWITVHFYFRRVVFDGRERIPDDEPVILIANHSASFLDAMLLAVLMKRPLNFYARSDIFRKPWANRILRTFHMMPIYNIEHGKADLVRNEETFSEGEAILNDRGLLLIFPEGLSRVERVMLPLKKGTARVALQTESRRDFRLGIKVFPIGINYSRHRFRADVWVQTGDPIHVDKYAEVYRESPPRAITQLTRELESKFGDTMFFVEQPARTALIERLLELFRNDAFHASGFRKREPVIRLEKEVCEKVSALTDAEAEALEQDLVRYDRMLEVNGLEDRSVNGRYRFALWHLFVLLLSLPVFLAGFAMNAVLLRFAKWVADRTVTRVDFYTSVVTAVGGLGYVVWWLLLMVTAAFVGEWWYWLLVLTAPLTLFLAMSWWESLLSFVSHLRFIWKKRSDPAWVAELKALRERLAIWSRHEGRTAAS
jgi:glycerol-3-phosphate O-acyltransferase/dihydroxyacetone phosphate acyltransferase